MEPVNNLYCGARHLVPQDFPTIQSAIDNVKNQSIGGATQVETIVVSPGVYKENIDLMGKGICLTSTLSDVASEQAAAAAVTILDGGFKGPVISSSVPFQNGATFTEVTFFTIQHGGLSTPGSPASNYGGIYSANGVPSFIEGNIIDSNNYGGIVVAQSLINTGDTFARIIGNSIRNNSCWGILVVGGAISASGNDISDNQAAPGGCIFYDAFGNGTLSNGSGVAIQDAGPTAPYDAHSYLYQNTVTNNVETTFPGTPAAGGAGVLINGSYVSVIGNTIHDNSAPAARGGAIDIEGSSEVLLETNLIYANQAGCGGAAISLNFDNIRIPSIVDAASPGGITDVYSVLLANNTIADNTGIANSSCTADGPISFPPSGLGSASALFINNVISNSLPTLAMLCEKQASPSLASQVVFDHNLLYNAGQAFFGDDCIDESMNGLLGNISADPKFVTLSSGPYQLTPASGTNPGSPGIDAGNNAVFQIGLEASLDIYTLFYAGGGRSYSSTPITYPADVIGDVRFQDATNKTDQAGNELDIIDMGAYESTGKSDLTKVVSMFMFPRAYPAAGNNVLTSYALVGTNFVSEPLYASPGTFNVPNNIQVLGGLAPYSGALTFNVDGQQVGSTSSFGNEYDLNIATGAIGLGSVPYCFTPGVHILTSTYQPAPGVTTGRSAAVVATIPLAITTLTLKGDPVNAVLGMPVTFTVTASAYDCSKTFPGLVTLVDVTTNAVIASLALDPATGIGSFTTTNLPLGASVLKASFGGDSLYAANDSNEVTITVYGTAALTVASSQNPVYALIPFKLSSQMIPAPIFQTPESIEFYSATPGNNPSPIASATIDANGLAISSLSLGAGVYTITANYPGDNVYLRSVSAPIVETVLINPTSLAVNSGSNPANAFRAIPLMSHISTSTANAPAGSIVGTISFVANGKTVGSGTIDGNGDAVASVELAAGTYTVVAKFDGNDSFAASQSAAIPEMVNTDGTATTLVVTPNPGYTPNGSETLTAVVAASSSATVPAGTVTFYDSFNNVTTALQAVAVDMNGQAVLTTSGLGAGVHVLTASYGASANFQASTSAAVTLTILLRDFGLSTQPSITLQTKHHGLLPVTVTSIGGFADTIGLSCSGLPMWASCNFPKGTSVNLAGNGTAMVTIDIDTDAVLDFASVEGRATKGWRGAAVLALLLPLGLLPLRRRSWMTGVRLFAVLFVLGIGATIVGCSGMPPPSTAPGTYVLTLTGKGAATGQVHSVNFSLIVTP